MDEPTCRNICEHVDAILAGDRGDPAWQALKRHLELCPPCVEYVRQIGLTIEAVRALPRTESTPVRAELLRRFEAWASSQKG